MSRTAMKSDGIRVTISPDRVLAKVPRYLTGACLEDVNHEVYGGIYSQMIFGESFEEEPMEIHPKLNPAFAGLEGTVSCLAQREHLKDASEVRSWQPLRTGTATGRLRLTTERSRRGGRSQLIEFVGGTGCVGIENRGLNRWGMHVRAEHQYEGRVVVQGRTADGAGDGELTFQVALESGDGKTVYAEQTLVVPTDRGWHTLRFSLTPNKTAEAGRFRISLRAPGRLWVDYALLQPGPWGCFRGTAARKDIAEALVREGLTVLRYGGCMINTNYDSETSVPGSGYRWKKMIGPREERPPYRGTFYRYNSNGFGIVDFIQLCEAAGFLCVPALNVNETPQDFADFVQYVNGPVGTTWGALRAAHGHPSPYRLRYVQIGNEEPIPPLLGRIRPILQAIRNTDETVTPILGAGFWAGDNRRNADIFGAVIKEVRGFRVLWDMHVGGDDFLDAHQAEESARWMRRFIDEVGPGNEIGLCVLEENGGLHTVQRALGHAHIVMTFERLGLIEIDCPANCLQPWQQHDNAWDQGQVFFTPSQVWGMPPYYAQQMLSRSSLPMAVEAKTEGGDDLFDVTATVSEDGRTRCVKLLNMRETPADIVVSFEDGWQGVMAEVNLLTGPLDGENTPQKPTQYATTNGKGEWTQTGFRVKTPGYAFVTVRFER